MPQELPRAPAQWPLISPDYFVGYIDLMFIVTIGKKCPIEKLIEMTQQVAVGIDTRRDTDRVVVMYHVPGELGSDLRLIRALKDVVKDRQEKLRLTTKALTLCTTSVVARAAFRTLMTIGGLPYPVHVTGAPELGIAWLKDHLPDLDTPKVISEYDRILSKMNR